MEEDPLLNSAIELVVNSKRVSVSGIQRHFRIGYNRAAVIIDALERLNIVSPIGSAGSREILCGSIDDAMHRKANPPAVQSSEEVSEEKPKYVPDDIRLSAITTRRIVIWLDQIKEKTDESDPVYIVRSFSPFEFLAEKQKKDKDLAFEPNGDIIVGYRFCATMQFRTPVNILKQHGRIDKKASWKIPKIAREEWQGIWIAETTNWRDIGIDIDEMPMGTMASELGQIPSDGGDFLRFMLFVKQIQSEEITHDQKKRWLQIGYQMIGQDGEPFCKFMDHYGNNIDEITSRLLYLSRNG
ncbi:DNA translocase FtsK [Yersinia enterocolitica]